MRHAAVRVCQPADAPTRKTYQSLAGGAKTTKNSTPQTAKQLFIEDKWVKRRTTVPPDAVSITRF